MIGRQTHAGVVKLPAGETKADVPFHCGELDSEKAAVPHHSAEYAGLNLAVRPQAGTGYEPADLGSGDQHAPEDDTGGVSRNAQAVKSECMRAPAGIVKAEARRPRRVPLPRTIQRPLAIVRRVRLLQDFYFLD
jgi:hypothetical protein